MGSEKPLTNDILDVQFNSLIHRAGKNIYFPSNFFSVNESDIYLLKMF